MKLISSEFGSLKNKTTEALTRDPITMIESYEGGSDCVRKQEARKWVVQGLVSFF